MHVFKHLLFLILSVSFINAVAQKQGKDIIEKKPMYDAAIPNVRICQERAEIKYEILKDRSHETKIINTDGFSTDQNKVFWTSKGYYKIKDQSKLMPEYELFNKAEKLITKELNLYKTYKNDIFNSELLQQRKENVAEACSLFEQVYKLAKGNGRKDVCIAALSNMAYLSYMVGASELWKKTINYLAADEVGSADYGGTNAKFYAKHDPLGQIGLRGNGWLVKSQHEGLGLCESKAMESKVFLLKAYGDSSKIFDQLELSISLQNKVEKVAEKEIDTEIRSEIFRNYLPASYNNSATLFIHFKNTSDRIITLDNFVILIKVGEKQVYLNDKLVIERLMSGDKYDFSIKFKTNYFISPGIFNLQILDLPVAFDENMGQVIKKDNATFSIEVSPKTMMKEWYFWTGNTKDLQQAIQESGVTYPL